MESLNFFTQVANFRSNIITVLAAELAMELLSGKKVMLFILSKCPSKVFSNVLALASHKFIELFSSEKLAMKTPSGEYKIWEILPEFSCNKSGLIEKSILDIMELRNIDPFILHHPIFAFRKSALLKSV